MTYTHITITHHWINMCVSTARTYKCTKRYGGERDKILTICMYVVQTLDISICPLTADIMHHRVLGLPLWHTTPDYSTQTCHWYFQQAIDLNLYKMADRGGKLRWLHCHNVFSDSRDIFLAKIPHENHCPKMVPTSPLAHGLIGIGPCLVK